jgi:ADP-ribose pyrophosphatase YjhB (NUDIX family)
MDYLKQLRTAFGHDKILINCSAVWVENENGVLLERRGDDGNWGLIGGVMNIDESVAECALRELKEETGLAGEIQSYIGVYSSHHHQYPNGDEAQPIVHFFEVSVDAAIEPQISDESRALRYFTRNQLPNIGMPQHQVMVEDAIKGKRAVAR